MYPTESTEKTMHQCYHIWRVTEHARDGRNAMARVTRGGGYNGRGCYSRSGANKALGRVEDPFGLQLMPDGKPDALVLKCRPYCGCRKPRARSPAPCPALEGETAPEFRR